MSSTFLIIYTAIGAAVLLARLIIKHKMPPANVIGKYALQTFVPFLTAVFILLLYKQPWNNSYYKDSSDVLYVIGIIALIASLFIPHFLKKENDGIYNSDNEDGGEEQ